MIATLLATWLLTPIAPLNPIEQDTLPSIALHLSAGISAPNGVMSSGVELSASYEMRVTHPLVVRGSIELQRHTLTSFLFPRGDKTSINLAVGGIYYRGTNRLTGYIGAAAVYGINFFDPTSRTLDSLNLREGVTEMSFGNKLGYRLTLGLRIRKKYSFEINVTEMYPNLRRKIQITPTQFRQKEEKVRTGTFRFMFGYLLPIAL